MKETPTPSESYWPKILSGVLIAPFVMTMFVAPHISSGRDWATFVCLVATSYYASLLGFWTGLGLNQLRLIWIAFAIPALTVLHVATSQSGGSEFFAILFYVASIVALLGVTTFVLRCLKGVLRRIDVGEKYQEALQFGIWHLIVWTIITSLLLTAGRAVLSAEYFSDFLDPETATVILIITASLATNAVIGIWALFGKRISWSKVAILLLFLVLGGVSLAVFVPRIMGPMPGGVVSRFIFLMLGNQICILATLFAIRKLGYRFVK